MYYSTYQLVSSQKKKKKKFINLWAQKFLNIFVIFTLEAYKDLPIVNCIFQWNINKWLSQRMSKNIE